ncbi:MAG: hypothetical protein IPJ77_22385 [Planctomycetes bacterium]|nr:hypothetical protein [Planctomycetota bacterium]
MNDSRLGGTALILGAVGTMVTMAAHPTGHDLASAEHFERVAFLAKAVHALAIASVPITFLGVLALARRLDGPDRSAIAGLVVFGFAAVSVVAAAVVSGFVTPELMRRHLDVDAAEKLQLHHVLDLAHELNQAFARVYVVASSVAIGLWSVAILRGRGLAKGLGGYGLVLGAAATVGILSGHLRLDVHGFGAVVLGQAVWWITAGVLLRRAG